MSATLLDVYTKHHTKALVLSAHNSGESDRVYSLLTSDFGKVYAKAHGVRQHAARHKAGLQPLSQATVSLVRSKTGWRITNVSPLRSLYTHLAPEKIKLALLVRVLKLVRRLLAGEGHAHEVFAIIDALGETLLTQDLSSEDLRNLEVLTVARMLQVLGYVKREDKLSPYLSDISDFSSGTLSSFGPHSKEILTILNEALEASQL